MIQIQMFDKNGRELCEGDTIRQFSIDKDCGWDFFEGYPEGGRFPVDCEIVLEWKETVFRVDIDDGMMLLPMDNMYTPDDLIGLFSCDNSDSDWQEIVLGTLRKYTKAQDEAGILREISGWEIVV